MKLPDGTILMHGSAPYDPVKAHEYYIRTRKLKGRKRGQGQEHPEASRALGKKASTFTVRLRNGKTATLNQKQLAEQKAYADQRVASIKKKLADLNRELKKRMAEARKAEAKKKRGPTAADKAEKARDAKKYREKNQQKLANKRKSGGGNKSSNSRSKSESVDDLKKRVSKVKGSLRAAVERQRSLSSATKNG